MADDPKQKLYVELDGCTLWLIFLALAPLTGALYAIANAIKGLAHG